MRRAPSCKTLSCVPKHFLPTTVTVTGGTKCKTFDRLFSPCPRRRDGTTGTPACDAACAHCSGLQLGPEREMLPGRFSIGHLSADSHASRNAFISRATYSRSSGAISISSSSAMLPSRVSTPDICRAGINPPPAAATERSTWPGWYLHPGRERSRGSIRRAPSLFQSAANRLADSSLALARISRALRATVFRRLLSRCRTSLRFDRSLPFSQNRFQARDAPRQLLESSAAFHRAAWIDGKIFADPLVGFFDFFELLHRLVVDLLLFVLEILRVRVLSFFDVFKLFVLFVFLVLEILGVRIFHFLAVVFEILVLLFVLAFLGFLDLLTFGCHSSSP